MDKHNQDREPTGRFLPGNQISKGIPHPRAKETASLRKELLACCKPEHLRELYRRHLELIQSRDEKVALAAIALFYERFFGKPKETLDVEVTHTGPALNASQLSDEQLAGILDILDQTPASRPTIIDVQPLTDGADLLLPGPMPQEPLSSLESTQPMPLDSSKPGPSASANPAHHDL